MPNYSYSQSQDVATTGSGLGAGAGDHLPVGDYGGMDYRSAMRFGIPAWSAWTAITNATLTFYISDHQHVAPKNSSIFCSRMNVPVWTRDQGTWDCESGFSASNNSLYSHIQSVSTDRITFGSGSIANAAKVLNVTAMVQYYWANNTYPVFVFDNNGADQYTELWSLGKTGTTYNAILSIDYETAGPPQTITVPLETSTSAVYAPTLTKFSPDKALSLSLLDADAELYNIALYRIAGGDQDFVLPLLSAATTVYTPTVILDQFLTVPLLTSAPTLSSPTLIRGPITFGLPLMTPGVRMLADTVPTGSSVGPRTTGMRFTVNRSGRISRVRYYHQASCPDDAIHTVSIWTDGGVLLDTADDVHTINPGARWREVELPSPVVVDAGSVYRTSTFQPDSSVLNSTTAGAPPTSLTTFLTTGACYYDVGATEAFPTTSTTENFHVDVVFETTTLFAPALVNINAPGQAIWTAPANTLAVSDLTPTLTFAMPSSVKPMHFQMQLDTTAGFAAPVVDAASILSQTGWEYWNGSGWVPVTAGGVSQAYAGNEARYTVQSALTNGIYYRRVRAGVA